MSVWVLSIIQDYRYNKTKVKKHYKQRWHWNWDWSRKHLTWILNEPGILMTLETEDVTVDLQNTNEVKTLLETVLKTDANKSLFVIVTNDGYVVARTCPNVK